MFNFSDLCLSPHLHLSQGLRPSKEGSLPTRRFLRARTPTQPVERQVCQRAQLCVVTAKGPGDWAPPWDSSVCVPGAPGGRWAAWVLPSALPPPEKTVPHSVAPEQVLIQPPSLFPHVESGNSNNNLCKPWKAGERIKSGDMQGGTPLCRR